MGHPVRMCGMRRPSHAILGWIGIALVSASCFPVQPRLHVQPRPVPSRLFEVSRPSAVTGPQTRPSPLTTMPTVSEGAAPHRAVLDRYCVSCHNERLRTAGLALDTANIEQVAEGAEVWEKVATKLRTGGMPPRPPAPGRPDLRQVRVVARDPARPRIRDAAGSGPHRDLPPPEPGRVPKHHPRPARARRRGQRAAAGRRYRRARLRQHGGRAHALARADGALRVGGSQDRASRRRTLARMLLHDRVRVGGGT